MMKSLLKEWTYCGEYTFMLSMTEDEDKVKRVVGFNNKGPERLLGLVKRARANMEKADAKSA